MNHNAEIILEKGFAKPASSSHSMPSPLFNPRQKLIPNLSPRLIELPEAFEAYSELKFMQAGSVRDSWLLKNYQIDGNKISSRFDRKYHSALKASPSHVVPTTFAAVAQHLAFIYGSELFGFDHQREERIKLWPTEFQNQQRNLIAEEEDLIVELTVNYIQHLRSNMYMAEAVASVNQDATMTMKCVVYTI